MSIKKKEAIITIVGFLGSGKTTLLKYLTKVYSKEGWDPFIILNDYENADLDALQFIDQLNQKSIQSLSGSCICCNGVHKLREYVNQIPLRDHGVTLIEANGTTDACSLAGFLGVGLDKRFFPPIQLSVVNVRDWQKRGEHNELEANQIQLSSLIVLTHLDNISKERKKEVIKDIKKINPIAKISHMEELDIALLPNLSPLNIEAKKINHLKTHWASCSVDLPEFPNKESIRLLCNNIPKSILRIKGCAKISGDEILTYFERTPDGEITIRPFTGIQTTRAKLLTVGLGSEEFLLKNSIKNILTN